MFRHAGLPNVQTPPLLALDAATARQWFRFVSADADAVGDGGTARTAAVLALHAWHVIPPYHSLFKREHQGGWGEAGGVSQASLGCERGHWQGSDPGSQRRMQPAGTASSLHYDTRHPLVQITRHDPWQTRPVPTCRI